MGEKGLAGTVRTLPLEKIFELPNVKKVRGVHPCSRPRQYTQPHMHACFYCCPSTATLLLEPQPYSSSLSPPH